jgi:hypothetical protein
VNASFVYLIQSPIPGYKGRPWILMDECCWSLAGEPVLPLRDLLLASTMRREGHRVTLALRGPGGSVQVHGTPPSGQLVTRTVERFNPLMQIPAGALVLQEPVVGSWPGYPWPATPFRHWELLPEVLQEYRLLVQHCGYTLPSRWPVVNMPTTTGCVGQCTFCVWSGRKFQERQPEAVMRELELLNPERVYVMNAYLTPSWTREWIRLGGWQDWGTDLSPVCRYGRDLLAQAKAKGLSHVRLGPEALTDAGMQRLHKPFGLAQALELIRDCVAVGLDVVAELRSGHGETVQEVQDTGRVLRQLQDEAQQGPGRLRWHVGPIYWTPASPGWAQVQARAVPFRQSPDFSLVWTTPPAPDVSAEWVQLYADMRARGVLTE